VRLPGGVLSLSEALRAFVARAISASAEARSKAVTEGVSNEVTFVGYRAVAVPMGELLQVDPANLHLPGTRCDPLRRGQPRKLDDVARGRLLGLMSYGLSFRQAAARLGVHHQTLFKMMKRDEEFA
jgi:hypothetical protein